MSPTPRAALALAVVALGALVLPIGLVGLGIVAVATFTVIDVVAVRRRPVLHSHVPATLSRGIPERFSLRVDGPASSRLEVRQPVPADLEVSPARGSGAIVGSLVARRRGRHRLVRPAVRSLGPFGFGCVYRRVGEDRDVLVYPDLYNARRLALAVRQGTFREPGRRAQGPLGLGTEFDSIRDYLPDDDIRQVNWTASARTGRPMSNVFRVEQDRDVICVIDTGRLMAAPLGDRTRVDAATDATAAVALVADQLGDRCGVIAFDEIVQRRLAPRRAGGSAVVQAVFDIEPRPVESDYELAFRLVGGFKRALVVLFVDLLEEAAARPLLAAMPLLARKHAVIVAVSVDSDLAAVIGSEPTSPAGVYRMAVALDALADARLVIGELRRAGAEVVEAAPRSLAQACVGAYLRSKARARV